MFFFPFPLARAARLAAPAICLLGAAASCASEGGRPAAFVANSGGNQIQVIDLESGRTLRRIYAGAGPWRLAPSPDGASLWAQHWTSGTTAVIGLKSLEVQAMHPYRGPGTFSADGRRFWTFHWPGYELAALDADNGSVLSRTVTEVGKVAGLVGATSAGLYLFQQDLMSSADGPRYSYVLAFDPNKDEQQSVPRSLPTGLDPEDLLAPSGQPFLLTADRGTDGITLVNSAGDRRSLHVCAAPRRLALSGDQRLLAVGCWRAGSSLTSEVALMDADFSARPWPTLKERARMVFEGALADLQFGPDDRSLYGLDEVFGRLIEWDANNLAQLREIETASTPRDLAVMRLAESVPQATNFTSYRQALHEVLDRTRSWGASFDSLAWTEVVSWRETPVGEGFEPRPSWKNHQFLSARGAFRSQSPSGLRIADGGWTYSIRQDGRFWRTPRQELLARVLALPNLSAEEAVRLLAGDFPGGPFPSGGIAADVFCRRETADGPAFIWGASRVDEPVSQVWIDATTGAPLRLIERFPSFDSGGHGAAAPPRTIETRFLEWRTLPGGAKLPSRLERVVAGAGVQTVRFEEVRAEKPPDGFFDLTRLGGVKPGDVFLPSSFADTQPDRSTPIMQDGYLPNPWAPHPPYATNPPTSGPRVRELARWGVHAHPVPLGLQVHNLEHGGVIVQYNCEQPCDRMIARLESLTRLGLPVIVAPYPYMDSRIAVAAWGRLLTLGECDEERIRQFIQLHAGVDHHGQPPAPVPAPRR